MASKEHRLKTSGLDKYREVHKAYPEGHELNDRGKKILSMLTALEDEDGLTPWEIGFVHNQMDWFYRMRDLTPAQFDTLEKIYRRFN